MSSSNPPGPPPGRPPMMPTNGFAGPPGPPAGAPFRPPMGHAPYGAFPPPPPTLMPNFAPPLPPGWSEHTAPNGRTKYYFNSQTKESTYTRPVFSIPSSSSLPAPQPPQSDQPAKKKRKKEKAKEKVDIPGTTWQRITTNEANVFYFEKESKRSEWSVPDAIASEVAELEQDEKAKEDAARLDAELEEERRRAEIQVEKDRIRREVEEESRKRRTGEQEGRSKRPKLENGEEGDGADERGDGDDGANGEKNHAEGGDEAGDYGPADEEDEAEWMKAVAAEFAAADAKTQQGAADDEQDAQDKEEQAAQKVFAVPEKVNVSMEEGKALFRALLAEKDISPFAPWDQSLPLFINDPRYVLLSSEKDRREVYEEYCRTVGRARRLNKTTAKPETTDHEKEYKALMREVVTSTRTRWDDFRKEWKKDRRFYSFGRDDRDREKLFKTHLRELGERKRADAQRAELDFKELLAEEKANGPWSDVKKKLSHDPRYDAVGSSSLREELYNDYVKTSAGGTALAAGPTKQERAAASLKSREEKVRSEQVVTAKEMGKSRAGAGREEAERLFGSLLVDQVRDHETTWPEASRFLASDPRFSHPSLSPFDRQRLFSDHINRISSKRSNALHQLFETHSPSLETTYEAVYAHVIDDSLVRRLQLSPEVLEHRYDEWKASRFATARGEFDQMLGDNAFVDFWSKMRKKTLDESAAKVKEDEMDDGEGLGEGGDADMIAMSKHINLEEIKSVLRRDKRYRQFDHMPEERERWLKAHLEEVEAASGSKTVHNVQPRRE